MMAMLHGGAAAMDAPALLALSALGAFVLAVAAVIARFQR